MKSPITTTIFGATLAALAAATCVASPAAAATSEAQVKDPAPVRWRNNGTMYERTVQVQDETPDGFTDDGTQWIKRDDPPLGMDR